MIYQFSAVDCRQAELRATILSPTQLRSSINYLLTPKTGRSDLQRMQQRRCNIGLPPYYSNLPAHATHQVSFELSGLVTGNCYSVD